MLSEYLVNKNKFIIHLKEVIRDMAMVLKRVCLSYPYLGQIFMKPFFETAFCSRRKGEKSRIYILQKLLVLIIDKMKRISTA
jgi:hypothetical protein